MLALIGIVDFIVAESCNPAARMVFSDTIGEEILT